MLQIKINQIQKRQEGLDVSPLEKSAGFEGYVDTLVLYLWQKSFQKSPLQQRLPAGQGDAAAGIPIKVQIP